MSHLPKMRNFYRSIRNEMKARILGLASKAEDLAAAISWA